MRNKTIGICRVAVCALFAVGTIAAALAQDRSAARYVSPGEADQALASSQVGTTRAKQMRAMLLQPAGWMVNWERPGDKGQSEMAFEARGDKVVVKIKNITLGGTCEKDVTIADGKVKFDGCYDAEITLRFDPADRNYPFKGGSPRGYGYMFQPRDAG